MHDTKRHPIILYMANYPHHCFQVECVYNIFRKLTKSSISHYLTLFTRMYPLPKNVVSTELKQVLNIRKHLPIIINASTILFPIKHKRARMQFFINGMQITGIKKENQHTRLIFSNGKHLLIEAPYQFIHRKWLECIFLHHFIFIEHD